jgi:hypothetical protein
MRDYVLAFVAISLAANLWWFVFGPGAKPKSPPAPTQPELAKRLRAARSAVNLTPTALSARLNQDVRLPTMYVGALEAGQDPIRPVDIQRWMKSCGLPEDWER